MIYYGKDIYSNSLSHSTGTWKNHLYKGKVTKNGKTYYIYDGTSFGNINENGGLRNKISSVKSKIISSTKNSSSTLSKIGSKISDTANNIKSNISKSVNYASKKVSELVSSASKAISSGIDYLATHITYTTTTTANYSDGTKDVWKNTKNLKGETVSSTYDKEASNTKTLKDNGIFGKTTVTSHEATLGTNSKKKK